VHSFGPVAVAADSIASARRLPSIGNAKKHGGPFGPPFTPPPVAPCPIVSLTTGVRRAYRITCHWRRFGRLGPSSHLLPQAGRGAPRRRSRSRRIRGV